MAAYSFISQRDQDRAFYNPEEKQSATRIASRSSGRCVLEIRNRLLQLAKISGKDTKELGFFGGLRPINCGATGGKSNQYGRNIHTVICVCGEGGEFDQSGMGRSFV